MTDYQESVISLMKHTFGPAAIDITDDILDSIGYEIASLRPDTIENFAKEAENKAASLISKDDAAQLYKKLTSL